MQPQIPAPFVHNGIQLAVPAGQPRICFAFLRVVETPVCSMKVEEPLCGQATRDRIDSLTREEGAVTCLVCLDKLANRDKPMSERMDKPVTQETIAAASTATQDIVSSPVKRYGNLRGFLESLDSEQLRFRLAELEGEREAVKILLKVAQAREKARDSSLREDPSET